MIDEVRERADIVSVISRHVTLKRSGNRLWGLCPFHDEKTSSFSVHEERQFFYCFGCHASGNVFQFKIRHDGLDFPEAVRVLAAEVGVEIPDTGGERDGKGASALAKLNDSADEYFRRSLRGSEGAAARRYLEQRGVPQDLVERFGLGFAPARSDGLLRWLAAAGHDLADAETLGLVKPSQNGPGHYDGFRDRLIFPITEPGGRTVGFGGRALADRGPKYLNSPESPLYRKSRVLFGLPLALDAIRGTGRVVVVEGYFDLVALHRAGIFEGVAPCGTSLTTEHARRLHRYCKEVVLLFDGDEAGQSAAERSLELLLAEGLVVKAAFLPAGQDPDDVLEQSGPGALRECVDAAELLLDKLIEREIKGLIDDPTRAGEVSQQLAPFLRAIPNPVERDGYTRRLSSYLEMQPQVLAQLVAQPDPQRRAPEPSAAPAAALDVPERLEPVYETLIAALCDCPEALEELDALAPEARPTGVASALLGAVEDAVREHAGQAVGHLLSPDSSELDPGLRALLGRICARDRAADLVQARRAARDCVTRLQLRLVEHEMRKRTARLDSCKDPEAEMALLEEQQVYMTRKRELEARLQIL